jgi:WD40 repeat protein
MAALRTLDAEPRPARKGADLYACAYTSDGAYVLSAGWDGFLRLWEAPSGVEVSALQVGGKPLSCCAISPDGRQWLAASIDGVLSVHDAATMELVARSAAHTRPISSIHYAPDGAHLATASWDRQVVMRKVGKEREPRIMTGHKDIVAGCRFTGDGARLLSWSYDGTLRLWDATTGREAQVLRGHDDRVTAAGPSPDGRWAVSGGRDGAVHLWDLSTGASVCSIHLNAELRGCLFLLDGASIVAVDAAGGVVLLCTPDLESCSQVQTRWKPQSADLSPSGKELALGCEDGLIHFVGVEGVDESPLIVTAGRRPRPARGVFGRLLGKPRVTYIYEYTCPVCRRPGEAAALPAQPFPCGGCRRTLRMSAQVRQLQEI